MRNPSIMTSQGSSQLQRESGSSSVHGVEFLLKFPRKYKTGNIPSQAAPKDWEWDGMENVEENHAAPAQPNCEVTGGVLVG